MSNIKVAVNSTKTDAVRIVNLLKTAAPNGLTSENIRSELKISAKQFKSVLMMLRDAPVGYDIEIDNKYYWVGR
ncbi:MAG: hypothetical protein ACTTH7_09105 [Treponema sp.]